MTQWSMELVRRDETQASSKSSRWENIVNRVISSHFLASAVLKAVLSQLSLALETYILQGHYAKRRLAE